MPEVKDTYSSSEYQNFEWCGFNVEHGFIDCDFLQHTHDFYEAFIIISGSAKHIVGDHVYPIGHGDIFVIKGDISHGFQEVQSLEIVNIMYDPDLFANYEPQLSSLPGFRPLFVIEPEIRLSSHYHYKLTLEDKDLNFVVTMVDFMIQEIEQKMQYHNIMVKMSMYSLFAFLSVKYTITGGEPRGIKILSESIRYMQENLAQQVSLQDIASSLFISTRQLQRLFKQYYNIAPGEYLTKLRLRQAYTLLSNNQLQVTEVAERCGFADPSYFSRVFKKEFGVRPGKIAKLIQPQ